MHKRPAILLTCALAAALIAPRSKAQLASDEIPHERTVPRAELIKTQMQESHRLGAIRVRPIFGLRDTGYDNNVFGTSDGQEIGDWRSTVRAGANLLLPLGRKMYLTGIAAPEYTWYSKLTDRRMFGGEYGGSLVALFNRLSFEGGADTQKTISPINSELERSAPGRQTDGFARGEVDIFRKLSVFGSFEDQRQRYDVARDEGLNLAALERNERFTRGGIRYHIRSYVDASLALESGTTDFVSARDADNATHAVLFGIHYDRPRLFVNLSAGSRKGEARGLLSTFPAYSTATGSYYIEYQLAAPPSVDVYGHRSVVYGLFAANPYFFETRNGAGLTIPAGQRFKFRAFSEIGTNDYPIVAASSKRSDHVTTYGGGIAYRLYRRAFLNVLAYQTRYDSTIDTYDRSLFRVATAISFGGENLR